MCSGTIVGTSDTVVERVQRLVEAGADSFIVSVPRIAYDQEPCASLRGKLCRVSGPERSARWHPSMIVIERACCSTVTRLTQIPQMRQREGSRVDAAVVVDGDAATSGMAVR
jgi:dissimilatory sulfite reductase (desulfoviridin) alpha/beta subunit